MIQLETNPALTPKQLKRIAYAKEAQEFAAALAGALETLLKVPRLSLDKQCAYLGALNSAGISEKLRQVRYLIRIIDNGGRTR